jgi:hypothetical protein
MPMFEIPVAVIVNDTVVVEADTALDAWAAVKKAASGSLIELHAFMDDQGFRAVPNDVDVLQITGPPEQMLIA